MKNSLESIAVFLVGLISLGIIALIVWFNLIESKIIYNVPVERAVTKKVKTTKTNDYLSSMENYEDVDGEDDSDEDINSVKVFTGDNDEDELDDVVSDKSKSAYLKNLEGYAGVDTDSDTKPKKAKKKELKDEIIEDDESGSAEFVNELGSELDDILGDL